MPEPSKGFVMSFNPGSQDALGRCERRIADARQWLYGANWAEQLDLDLGTPASVKFWDSQNSKLAEMERSFYLCMYKLIALASSLGGMELSADGEDAIFWSTPSGLCGGLVFHSGSYGEHRLPIGEFSLHT